MRAIPLVVEIYKDLLILKLGINKHQFFKYFFFYCKILGTLSLFLFLESTEKSNFSR